jgi:probable rRNA maturation factor
MKTVHSPKIKIRNLQRKVPVKVVGLQKFAEKALALGLRLRVKKKTTLETLGEVSVLVVSDRRMASLHHRFMNESGPTDVMTFQHGEIFISADTALRNARQFGNRFIHELQLYIVHGLLHLQGFDDRNAVSARKMRSAENKVLNQLQGPD